MPIESRPKTLEEYLAWAKANLNTDFGDSSNKVAYEENLKRIKQSANSHQFFVRLKDFLTGCQNEYRIEKGADLFMSQPSQRISLFQRQPDLMLFEKPYDSAVDKSFRYNILENDPLGELREPKGREGLPDGWLTPKNWFQILPDTIRTMIVCKYKDGPKLMAGRLEEHGAACGLKCYGGSREKDDGYYAFHFYVSIPCELDPANQDEESRSKRLVETNVKIEIQLTTQLQEALNQISHLQYEHSRIDSSNFLDGSWKWDFQSLRFKTAYLSHTLHLLEAIILDVRDQSTNSGEK